MNPRRPTTLADIARELGITPLLFRKHCGERSISARKRDAVSPRKRGNELPRKPHRAFAEFAEHETNRHRGSDISSFLFRRVLTAASAVSTHEDFNRYHLYR